MPGPGEQAHLREGPADEALVRRILDGNQEAFAMLYRRYGRLVHGVVRARLHQVDVVDVEDVVQEVFVSAARQLHTLEDPGALAPWLCSIARNQAVDSWRRRRRHVHDDVDGAPASSLVSGDTIVHLESRELAARALAALASLPDAYRETLVLRLVEGMSGPEIAAQTGRSEGAIRVNLHRGMQLLRGALRDD